MEPCGGGRGGPHGTFQDTPYGCKPSKVTWRHHSQCKWLRRAIPYRHAGILERGADAEKGRFVERRADDLETEGQAGRADPAGQRERGQPERIDAADEARSGEADVLLDTAQLNGSVADAGRGRGRRGGDEAIDLGPERVELALEPAADALCVDVIRGGDEAALIEKGEHVRAEPGAVVEVGL